MNRKTKLAVALLFVLPAFAREDYNRNFDKTVPMTPGQRLRIEHKLGDIVIRTQSKAELTVHAVIRVSANDQADAKRFSDNIRIDVAPAGSAMLVETVYPKQDWINSSGGIFGHNNISYSVSYEILMPESAPLELRNSFGAVTVSDLKAPGEITTSHGKLEFRNGRGPQRLENSFASVTVIGNAGDLTLTNTNGEVDVEDVSGTVGIRDRFGKVSVTRSGGGKIVNGNGAVDVSSIGGDLNVTTSFGAVHASAVKGNLIVNNQNGEIEALGIKGSAELNTSFAKVHFEDIGGPVTVHAGNSGIKGTKVSGAAALQTSFGAVDVNDVRKGITVINQNGSVTLDDVGEDTSVRTSFGLVKVTRIGGSLKVDNQNGGVNASGVRGGANVKTSFGGVSLDGVGGPVEVENQNGSVDVASGRPKGCDPISIRTSFSAIRVRVADDASYTVAAKTSFGKIHSDFPMMVSGQMSSDSVNGKIGGGACPLTLTDQNGSIEIVKR